MPDNIIGFEYLPNIYIKNINVIKDNHDYDISFNTCFYGRDSSIFDLLDDLIIKTYLTTDKEEINDLITGKKIIEDFNYTVHPTREIHNMIQRVEGNNYKKYSMCRILLKSK